MSKMSWVEWLGESARSDELTEQQCEGSRYLTDPASFDRVPSEAQLRSDFQELSSWSSLAQLRTFVGGHRLAVSTAVSGSRCRAHVWSDIVIAVQQRYPGLPAPVPIACACNIL